MIGEGRLELKTPKTKQTIGFKNKNKTPCIISFLNGESEKLTYIKSEYTTITLLDEIGEEKTFDKKELKYVIFALQKNSINRHKKYLKKKEKERMENNNEFKPNGLLFDRLGSKVKVVFLDGKAINDAQIIALSKFEINIVKENKEMIIFKHAVKYIQIIES